MQSIFLKVAFQLLIHQGIAYFQKDYNLTIERISLEYVNKGYFTYVNVTPVYYTRYEKRYNISFCLNQTIYGETVEDQMTGYKFQSNEYRDFPFLYKENACASYKNNIYGTKAILKRFDHNISEFDDCVMNKGCYYINNIFADASGYPPYAPRGRYMIDYHMYYKKNIHMVNCKVYIDIKPSNPLERVIAG